MKSDVAISGRRPMKIEVDLELCEDHAVCIGLAPTVFAFGPGQSAHCIAGEPTFGAARGVREGRGGVPDVRGSASSNDTADRSRRSLARRLTHGPMLRQLVRTAHRCLHGNDPYGSDRIS